MLQFDLPMLVIGGSTNTKRNLNNFYFATSDHFGDNPHATNAAKKAECTVHDALSRGHFKSSHATALVTQPTKFGSQKLGIPPNLQKTCWNCTLDLRAPILRHQKREPQVDGRASGLFTDREQRGIGGDLVIVSAEWTETFPGIWWDFMECEMLEMITMIDMIVIAIWVMKIPHVGICI